MMYKRWYLSPVSFFLSIFSKPVTAVFLPMALFFTYRASIPKEKKIRITLTYIITTAIIGGIIATVSMSGENIPIVSIFNQLRDFNAEDFWAGFASWSLLLRYDTLVLIFTLPLTIGLFLVSRKGIPEADSILVLIFGILLLAVLLPAFTAYNSQPYRFLPLIVFFAIGVGILLSKKITQSA